MNSGDQQQDPETLVSEGAELLKRREYDGALEKLDQALALAPDYVEALGNKATVLRMRDQNQKAVELLEDALNRAPKSAWLYTELGDTLRMQGRYAEALRALDRALDLDPDYAEALGSKGAVLFEQGSYRQALRALDQALALDPDYAFALGTKGSVLAELNRYEEALRTLAKASPTETNYRYVHAVRGWILCDAAYYDLALREVERALDLGLENVWTLSLKGWALRHLEANTLPQALAVYEDALEMEPDEVSLRTAYGYVLSLLGEKNAATKEYRSVIEHARDLEAREDAYSLANLAWCYFGLGQYDQAVRLYTTALSLNKGLIAAQFDLALTLIHTARRRHALREYQLALQWAAVKHKLRRRGLVHVALFDLKAAVAGHSRLGERTEVKEGLRLLQNKWNELIGSTKELQRMEELVRPTWEPPTG